MANAKSVAKIKPLIWAPECLLRAEALLTAAIRAWRRGRDSLTCRNAVVSKHMVVLGAAGFCGETGLRVQEVSAATSCLS